MHLIQILICKNRITLDLCPSFLEGHIQCKKYIIVLYNKYNNKNQIKKEKLTEKEIELIRNCCQKETEKMFKEIDNIKLMNEI